jgi:SAM-dependent methyltransferase
MHEAAATGFARTPELYERARPGYPSAAVAWLARRLSIGPGRRVLDLAAGTGKLSRPLAATGAEVVAVEPLAGMRARIGPGIEALEGTAEAIPLADAAVDAVTVAQAFHWFDGPAALAEIHRVLRRGGALALVWNRRPLEDPLQAAIERIVAPHRGTVPAHRGGTWRAAFEHTALFGPLEERTFSNEQPADAEALAGRVGSISFIAALPEEQRAALLAEVRALAGDGDGVLRYVCEVFTCDRRL